MRKRLVMFMIVLAVLSPVLGAILGCVDVGNDDDPQIEAESGGKELEIN